jgi:allantoate deiminase
MTDVATRWIEPAHIERRIEDLAQYGAQGETGVSRLVYSPEWVAAQDQIAAWMEEAGLRVARDAA